MSNPKLLVALVMVSAAACGDFIEETDVLDQEIGPGIRETQGRDFLGTGLDNLTGTTVDNHVLAFSDRAVIGATAYTFTVDRACLKATIGGNPVSCASPSFNGAVMTGMNGGAQHRVRIDGSTPIGATVAGYAVSLSISNGAWQPMCPAGYAVPLAGEWGRNGGHSPTPGKISWACLGDGVTAKAIEWGYVPDAVGAQWQLHQTAVRLGRADYCYDGKTRTVSGTGIEISDFDTTTPVPDAVGPIGPSPVDAPGSFSPNGFYFEAAWGYPGNGEGGHTLCLSKLRWQSLPLGHRCAGTLRDPRLDPEALYCEDYGDAAALHQAGALILNLSQYNDVGLYRWVSGSDQYTTMRGFHSQVSLDVVPPAVGFTHVRREGTLLTTPGVNVFQSAYGGQFVQLCTYIHPANGDHVTTIPSKKPPGYPPALCQQHEGWIFSTVPATLPTGMTTTALYRYKKSPGNDFLTTTLATAPAGYANPTLLGYVISAW